MGLALVIAVILFYNWSFPPSVPRSICLLHSAKLIHSSIHAHRLAAESGVERLIHFSDMGADLKHKSRRMRTKAQGDADLLRIFPDATIFK